MPNEELNTNPLEPIHAARRVSINAASLLASDVLNRGATFAIYALVARYCGAHSFGQLSLGLMLLYSFQVFSSVGMPTLIVRDVSKTPNSDAQYLANASLVVFSAFVLCYAALGLFVVVSGYAADTSRVIMLLGLSILPWSLTLISEALFRAKERMHLILWAAFPVHLAKLGLAFYLLTQNYGVTMVAVVLLAAHVSIFLIQFGILLNTLNSQLSRPSWAACKSMLRSSWKFCGIDALVAMWASVNVVLLSWYCDESAVGIFGAASQLLIPPSIALLAVVNSLFPIMCRRAKQNRERSQALIVMMFEVLMFIAVPGSVLLWFCSEPLISLIYSNDGFVSSATLVRIMLASLLCNAMTGLLGQLLMSYQREHINLQIVAVDVIFNVVCGFVLIPVYGVMGAATTVLLTSLLNCGLHLLATRSLFLNETASPKKTQFVIFWHTLASTAAMVAVFVATGDSHFIWAIVVAVTTFLVVFTALCYLSQVGALAFREHFLTPLSDA